ncbi:MAG: M20/M25/M40 family metallo-hydrolase [Abditibacteriota bacterium]|nr:M20/M25/M40 family metallo-hydrolase [Abditibacteriota bacterium]
MKRAQVNSERLLALLRRLLLIAGPSGRERQVADAVAEKAESLGFRVYEDGAGRALGTECGNLICALAGDSGGAPLILNAHLDTVDTPRAPALKEEQGVLRSDGSTILGADDRAGAAALLEAAETAIERGIPRGDLYLVFTVCEEQGLKGALHLEAARLPRAPWYSFDAGKRAGVCVYSAAGRASVDVTVTGPEAICVLSRAIASLPWGRLENGDTANTGLIRGSSREERACLQAALRSRSAVRMAGLKERMAAAFYAAAKEAGVRAEVAMRDEYPPLETDPAAPVCRLALEAAEMAGLEPALDTSGGGYDANRLQAMGFPAVALGAGYRNAHSPEEYIEAAEVIGAAGMAVSLIELFGKRRGQC